MPITAAVVWQLSGNCLGHRQLEWKAGSRKYHNLLPLRWTDPAPAVKWWILSFNGFRYICKSDSDGSQWCLASNEPHCTSLVNTVWRVNSSRPDTGWRSAASSWQNVGGEDALLGMFAGAASHVNLARQSPPVGSNSPCRGPENRRPRSLEERLGWGAAPRSSSSPQCKVPGNVLFLSQGRKIYVNLNITLHHSVILLFKIKQFKVMYKYCCRG